MEEFCKVLILDDEFIVRQGMKHMIDWEKEGFQVVGEGTNGQEGLALVEEKKPHIVLADIVMPLLDGIEFSRLLKERFPDVQLIILSSYDKFEYVKETLLNGAADYILKPMLEPQILLKTLKKAAKNIPGFQLNARKQGLCASALGRILAGYQENVDENAWLEVFPHSQFQILAMNLKEICGNRKARIAQLENEILEILEDQGYYVSVSLLMEETILCIVLNYRLREQKNVRSMVEICAAKMANLYEETFFVISGACGSIQQLKECYRQEILAYVNQKFYYPGKHLVEAKKGAKAEAGRFPYEDYTSLLMHRQFQEALDQFTDYIQEICRLQVDEYKVKNQTKNLLYSYLMEIEKYGAPSEELRQLYFKRIDESADVVQFLEELENEKGHLEALLREKLQTEGQKIARIRAYIYDHSDEDLELTELARVFGFSYHYLSSYFNQYAREGFSEYLNKIRVEKACRLLEAEETAISEISHQVGYSDHSYFCRVFKKLTGTTPSEYRKRKSRRDAK
ncbi:MAG: response regulator [Eubacteriales bacterium]|nr:response regulator [Eubacteriales bacterium]